MTHSNQTSFQVDPAKGFELMESTNMFSRGFTCNTLTKLGDLESAKMLEALAKNHRAVQYYLILLEFELLTREEFREKIHALVGAEE
jgi:hypothetical protein